MVFVCHAEILREIAVVDLAEKFAVDEVPAEDLDIFTCRHTSASTSAYVSIRQHTAADTATLTLRAHRYMDVYKYTICRYIIYTAAVVSYH